MNEQKRDALAEALMQHQSRPSLARGVDRCTCGDGAVGVPLWFPRHQADVALPLVDTWLAEAEQRVTDAVEAALRLITPDHITPMGARQVRAAMEKAEGER